MWMVSTFCWLIGLPSHAQSSTNGFTPGSINGPGEYKYEQQEGSAVPVVVDSRISLPDSRISSARAVTVRGGSIAGSATLSTSRHAEYMDVFWTPNFSGQVIPKTVTVKATSNPEAKITSISPLTWTPTFEVQGGWGEEAETLTGWNSQVGHYIHKRLKNEPRLLTFSTAGGDWLTPTYYRIRIPLNSDFISRAKVAWPAYYPGIQREGILSSSIRTGLAIDNRQVKLARDGAPAAKQATDPNLDKQVHEWEELADGQWVRYGHTLYGVAPI